MPTNNTQLIFQGILREKMAKAGLSANALEKKAGLKRSAVQNILYGRSKKPSAEILYAISKILNCSVDELIDQKEIDSTVTPNVETPTKDCFQAIVALEFAGRPYNTALYEKAIGAAHELFKERSLNPTNGEALQFIMDLYTYALESESEEIDITFSRWLAAKIFPSKKKA